MLSGSELWLLRLMADRGLALLDASSLLMVIEERGELRVAAASGEGTPRLRIMPVEGSALGALYRKGEPLALDRPRGSDAAWLHELGLEARAALVEPLSMEGHGGGLVIALRRDGGFRGPDRRALEAFAASVAQRLAAERSVEIERLRYGMEARERERTRWAREIHDETVQGLGALRLQLATARDERDRSKEAVASATDGEGARALDAAVDEVLEGLGREIEGLRHLITELRPAALDDLGLVPALQALARRAQAIDGLDVQTELELGADGERLDAELESTDLPRGAGGAHQRLAPRPGHAGGGLRLRRRPRRGDPGGRDRRRPGPAGRRPPRSPWRRPGGRLRHVGDARARRAGRRRAGAGRGRLRGGRPWHYGAPHGPAGRAPGGVPADDLTHPLVDEAEPPRVRGDLRARGEAELLDRAGAVGLDGALGDVQLLGDLGVGVAHRDQPHHLALALGERGALLR